MRELRAQAAAAAEQRSEAWLPVAAALASWLEQAKSSQRAEADLADVRKAIDWLRKAGQEIRDDRMAQLTKTSAEVWGLLRQKSNVELGPIKLAGASTQRHVSVDVAVDGVAGAALGVMSQGELHALGLALFLPRATSPDSPFRFIVIDDPVQSMDPAKVEGLARLLAWVGKDRQVLVFTHDDRLPEAIRRLQLPGVIWEVTRREGSVVEITKNDDPVSRFLDDARALARTTELPEDARAVVVAGFCRSALEAACHEDIRARRIKAVCGTRTSNGSSPPLRSSASCSPWRWSTTPIAEVTSFRRSANATGRPQSRRLTPRGTSPRCTRPGTTGARSPRPAAARWRWRTPVPRSRPGLLAHPLQRSNS